MGLFIVSTVIWILSSLVGSLARPWLGTQVALNEFIFGAFLVWSFELIVINGVFLRNTARSLIVSAIHPLSIGAPALYLYPDFRPVELGTIILLVAVVFLLELGKLKTRNGITSLQLLQAFLKTWVTHEPTELERCFLAYAKNEPVRTGILLFKTDRSKVVFILPGIHPGPFSPVGSYNLSELIYRTMHDKNVAPVVLHGVGGHERNSPTNELTSRYAHEIKQFVESSNTSQKGFIRGPFRSKVGIVNITTFYCGRQMIAMISSAPFISDDLDPATVIEASQAASELGLELSIVDAHNSVDGETQAQPVINKEQWKGIMSATLSLAEKELEFGFAHSSELDFKHGSDISEGGIGVAIFSSDNSKNVLVTVDSNNAVSGLRQKIADSIERMGFGFVELCTSDTHNFAARNLTRRGYFALGEQTKPEYIVNAIEELVRIAGSRVSSCLLDASAFEAAVPLIGHESLDDFAVLTKKATSLAKRYAMIAIPIAVLLLAVTLFY